jgi:hypothetical protein
MRETPAKIGHKNQIDDISKSALGAEVDRDAIASFLLNQTAVGN